MSIYITDHRNEMVEELCSKYSVPLENFFSLTIDANRIELLYHEFTADQEIIHCSKLIHADTLY